MNRDPFFDDGETGTNTMPTMHKNPSFDDSEGGIKDQSQKDELPPVPVTRKRLSSDIKPSEIMEDPTVTPRSPPSSPPAQPLVSHPETINEEVHESKSSSRRSSTSDSFESDIDDDEEDKRKEDKNKMSYRSTADIDVQTERIAVRDESIQTETINIQPLSKTETVHIQPLSKTETINSQPLSKIESRKIVTISDSKKLTIPLVKTLFNQSISSALPIISFCQPFSMTSHINDIILAMPRHLMIVNNQNSISVYPWQQSRESTSTILECYWCSFLYKLLVTTLEDNRLFIYDFISIIDSIKLRGRPLSIKQNYHLKQTNSSQLLPSSSSHIETIPVTWSQTRFTKSNSLGIYYCYVSNHHYSCMLTRIDHNTRQHIKAIDCSGGIINNTTRVCAMGLSDERVAIVSTNLIMIIYDAETLLGLKQINLSRWNVYGIRGVSALIYLWKTWIIFDPIEKKAVGLGKRKRQFVKILPDKPINACSMDNGTLALWLGYPGALLYYRLIE